LFEKGRTVIEMVLKFCEQISVLKTRLEISSGLLVFIWMGSIAVMTKLVMYVRYYAKKKGKPMNLLFPLAYKTSNDVTLIECHDRRQQSPEVTEWVVIVNNVSHTIEVSHNHSRVTTMSLDEDLSDIFLYLGVVHQFSPTLISVIKDCVCRFGFSCATGVFIYCTDNGKSTYEWRLSISVLNPEVSLQERAYDDEDCFITRETLSLEQLETDPRFAEDLVREVSKNQQYLRRHLLDAADEEMNPKQEDKESKMTNTLQIKCREPGSTKTIEIHREEGEIVIKGTSGHSYSLTKEQALKFHRHFRESESPVSLYGIPLTMRSISREGEISEDRYCSVWNGQDYVTINHKEMEQVLSFMTAQEEEKTEQRATGIYISKTCERTIDLVEHVPHAPHGVLLTLQYKEEDKTLIVAYDGLCLHLSQNDSENLIECLKHKIGFRFEDPSALEMTFIFRVHDGNMCFSFLNTLHGTLISIPNDLENTKELTRLLGIITEDPVF
jgi:hypothetical protein